MRYRGYASGRKQASLISVCKSPAFIINVSLETNRLEVSPPNIPRNMRKPVQYSMSRLMNCIELFKCCLFRLIFIINIINSVNILGFETVGVHLHVFLLTMFQCKGQKEELCELRGEVKRWRQEAQEQKESQAREVEELRKDLESTRGRLQLHRGNLEDLCRELETTHRQQRETDEEVRQHS